MIRRWFFAIGCATTLGAGAWSAHSKRIAVSESDLRAYLGVIAHDSMKGRLTGSRALEQVTDFVAHELARLGAVPLGDSGAFTQHVPITSFRLDSAGTSGKWNSLPLHVNMDFLPVTGAFGIASARTARVPYRTRVYGGQLGKGRLVHPDSAAGRVVVFDAPLRANGQQDYQLWSVRSELMRYRAAAAIGVFALDVAPRAFREQMMSAQFALRGEESLQPSMPPMVFFADSRDGWFPSFSGAPRSEVTPGTLAGPNEFTYESRDIGLETAARNVVALIPGSDPRLKAQYVVLSAHLDHLGIAKPDDRDGADSVYRGADDATGAAALLALVSALRLAQPRRSIVLLWTVGEEQGFLGSQYFANHPTVPRDSVVANITLDMIGRGGANDVPGGGPAYLELHGAARSADLAARVRAVNARLSSPFQPGERAEPPDSVRCDGDDWHFARWGIPSVRLSTGQSPDFHRVTDDVSRIDYSKFARVTEFAAEIAIDVANAADRPRKVAADPRRACVH
ncbi:MAG TPA: M28 family peptidase [Gemmatimonadaceae bacterium]|nr:M28 family peptidase [Gemmatimonadaceae bacterium]